MTPLTEADLLRMQEVQAKASGLPWSLEDIQRLRPFSMLDVSVPQAEANGCFCVAASEDWPRVTTWALEARRLLADAVKLDDYEHLSRVWKLVARRLLGE